ncbi:MinD superfamily P-loop ATPase, contains an inserted ferredoxin domain [Cetobacterium ceti]|uniref:MinD superfamily P-loop ATPase, contains an inserted ferredoxin domain n=1 Tax=Cetobacterium ceti TaxID=180163 RepID=A0A1T4NNQ7_9FUSO|nr:ATP-binding protein [Cetobacterium ceti]SJZ80822.1 MinD superfamily P-loop ATPase, contains an inserted ferredoxin domain [Cetobacterium ceti]
MKIAILSGKGGTGKTTVTGNLAINIPKSTVLDTDVEEPNGHLFFNPIIGDIKNVYTHVPLINMEKCNLCGKCSDFCKYSALFASSKNIIVFDESCHDCGACGLLCDQNAISFKKREIGKIYSGTYETNKILYGELNIGELSGVKIIKELHSLGNKENILLVDCPPGTSCSTVAAVSDCDFALIVVEPTPFGVSDMKMVVEMLDSLNIPYGLFINKSGLGDNEVYHFAQKKNIKILGEIPFNREIAKLYSEGKLFSKYLPEYRKVFINTFEAMREEIK